MKFFSRNKDKPITQDAQMEAEPKKSATPAQVAQHLESLAREKEADVLAQCEAKAEEYRADHAADVERWTFECRRYGDFLSLFIRRKGDLYRENEFYSGSLNLSQTRMELTLGHKPDWMGTVGYSYQVERLSAESPASWMSSNGLSMPPQGCEFAIHANWKGREGYPILGAIETPDYGVRRFWGSSRDSYQIALCTPNCPRPAEDDRITFYGPNQVLHTPAGLGQAAYQAILDQCAEWDKLVNGESKK